MKITTYKSFDTLPIINYNRILTDFNKSNLKYLYKLDFDMLESERLNEFAVKNYPKLSELWQKMKYTIKETDTTVKQSYIKALFFLKKYIFKEISLNQCNSVFFSYLETLNRNFTDFTLDNNNIFDNTKDLYNFVKQNVKFNTFDEFVLIRMRLFDLSVLDCRPKGKHDFDSEVSAIESVLQKDIDIFTVSVNKYISLKNYALSKQKQAKK